ncbi:MAG: hypothetical protein MZV49_14665 [Rhodopseudomonas palustris]|nr:hypothetical protein [Rhodopseudomonas palustris]
MTYCRRGACGRHVRRRAARGVAERDGVMHRIDVIEGDAGQGVRLPRRLHRRQDSDVIDAVRSYAPGFIFTTALPPAVCAAATAAIRHLKTSTGSANATRTAPRASRPCSTPPACR